ncbi:hypothetical protein SAMN05444422_101193 [Halobiforma haloterrestris]|uniref:DUF3426 domain-containing protein n=1 Tax=Natronobacterium haloterrestre TaxID=148448 RepID=A0A1I1D3E5_NATHA|nr:FxLYD domain-containing protein [Halobiforma haloterrestris]SFB68892.1 hypothetical protein SAMN05444422_101193 [Halobiforma haloterrestris]
MARRPSFDRRRALAALGSGVATAIAGCLGDDGLAINGDPRYEEGTVDVGDDAENRSAEEMTAAEALAEQEVTESVTTLDVLELVDHEFVLEDDYRGSTVQGTVENTGSDRIELAEVRVRVYDDAGAQLGRYLATVGDLDGGARWSFQVVVLQSPGDIARYDVTALGTPT